MGGVEPLDDELERLKRRRMLELQRRAMQAQQQEQPEQKEEKPNSRQILGRFFVDRAWEVYDAAWTQYPTVMPQVERLLVEAAAAGRIRERIDGESLFHFLREIGLRVHLQTTIRFKEHGELKTLEQKIRERP